jgi:predicted RNA-binding Zn-ribbon protein involved in translation (DUF1610 family)
MSFMSEISNKCRRCRSNVLLHMHNDRLWCPQCGDWADTNRSSKPRTSNNGATMNVVKSNRKGLRLVEMPQTGRYAILGPDGATLHHGTKPYVGKIWEDHYGD